MNITKEQHAAILPYWHYDKREAGSHGRALTAHFPDVGPGLRVGDRLEPNPDLPHIACLDDISDFPARVLWWRVRNNTLCTHRSSILNPEFQTASFVWTCCTLFFFGTDATHGLAHDVAVAHGWHVGHFRVDRGGSDRNRRGGAARRIVFVVQGLARSDSHARVQAEPEHAGGA